jgi:hypothetical protein
MKRHVTLVVINSLSYTGTTWLNMVLGSHPRAFALGPPDRIIGLDPADKANACRVHVDGCDFWSSFYDSYDPAKNFFLQLAEFSGRDVIVTNNPQPDGAGKQVHHPKIELKPIQLIRDARAVVASYCRKYPEAALLDATRDWLRPSLESFRYDVNDPSMLCLRYEDVLAEQRKAIGTIGRFIGVEYDESALRFWEHEHHATAGNAGTIMMVRLAQGLRAGVGENRDYYQAQLERLQADPEATFSDERWRDELSRRDRFAFDWLCGARNAFFGYERDAFTTEEHHVFSREIRAALGEAEGPSVIAAAASAPPRRRTTELRAQLNLAYLRAHGLAIDPRQVKRLGLAALVATAAAVGLAFIIGLVIGLLAAGG